MSQIDLPNICPSAPPQTHSIEHKVLSNKLWFILALHSDYNSGVKQRYGNFGI